MTVRLHVVEGRDEKQNKTEIVKSENLLYRMMIFEWEKTVFLIMVYVCSPPLPLDAIQ